jgi:hypothetical protein
MYAVDDVKSFYHLLGNLKETMCGIKVTGLVVLQKRESGLHFVQDRPAGYSVCEACKDPIHKTT